uniref:DUF223 domain-containing protein n=1 Tax=Caenorhabditis tropicalis TaxID=1561998 RepID=A0A1I7U1V9_9PELO
MADSSNTPGFLCENGVFVRIQIHDRIINHKRPVPFAICFLEKQKNRAYNQDFRGSTPDCDMVFNSCHGAYRSIQHVDLGDWYTHHFTDERTRKSLHYRTKSQYYAVRLTKPSKILAPLPTRVVDGKVEIDTELRFNHDNLEVKDSRGEQNWKIRIQGIMKSVFYDEYLGPVEIDIPEAVEIIKSVEEMRKFVPGMTEDEETKVSVTVSPHDGWFERGLRYPKEGIFVVTKINEFKDKNDYVVW